MFVPTTSIHGGCALVEEDPACVMHRDVLYVPLVGPHGHLPAGLYDRSGCAVVEAAYWVGLPEPHLKFGKQRIDLPDAGRAPAGRACVYLGPVDYHFGHFLLSSLSRLWPVLLPPALLHAGPAAGVGLLANGALGEMLAALGFGAADMVHHEVPVWLDEVLVPAPAFVENVRVHRAFARLGQTVGERLLAGVAPVPGPPVYFSKLALRAGVTRIANEAPFCDALRAAGVEVVCPETMSLARQAALFRDRPLVVAWGGSALHTSVFGARARMLVLNHEPILWSNQTMIDICCKNDTRYLHPVPKLPRLGAGHGFQENFLLPDPVQAARDVVVAMARMLDNPAGAGAPEAFA